MYHQQSLILLYFIHTFLQRLNNVILAQRIRQLSYLVHSIGYAKPQCFLHFLYKAFIPVKHPACDGIKPYHSLYIESVI